MARGAPVVYTDFSGGVNLRTAPYVLGENECRDVRNFTVNDGGGIRKRYGRVLLDEPATLDSVHSLFPVNTSTKSLLVVGKEASASNDRIITISTGGTPTTLVSSLTEGQRWEWVQAPDSGGEGPIFGINGVDPPKEWDGNVANPMGTWSASAGTIPTSYKYMLYHTDTICVTGSATYPGRVKFSGLTSADDAPDPRNWNDDYYVDMEPEDGQEMTGIGAMNDYIVVFKPHKTYVITDPATGAFRQLSEQIGCAAHRSIAETERGTIFLSEDAGVCMTDGSNIWRIGDSVETLITNAADSYPTSLVNAAGTYHRGSYYLSLPTASSSNDLMLEYHLDTESWWIHDFASNQMGLLDPGGTPKLYSACNAASKVCQLFVPDTYTDDDEVFDCYWESAYMPFGNPHVNKRITQFRADGVGDWEMSAKTSFNDSYVTLEELLWDGPTDFVFGGTGTYGGASDEFAPAAGSTERRYYTPTTGYGRAWSVRLDNSDANQMVYYSMTAFVRERTD